MAIREAGNFETGKGKKKTVRVSAPTIPHPDGAAPRDESGSRFDQAAEAVEAKPETPAAVQPKKEL